MIDKNFTEQAREELAAIIPEIAKLRKEINRLTEVRIALRTIVGEDEISAKQTSTAPGIISSRMGLGSKQKPSVLESVRAVVPDFGNQEFNAGAVEARLIEKGILPDVSQPRSQIITALGKLTIKGFLEKTLAPESGIQPHRFRLSYGYIEPLHTHRLRNATAAAVGSTFS